MKWNFLPIMISLLFASCQTSLVYTEHSLIRPESDRKMVYHLSKSEKDSSKLVVFLNENPDTLKLANSQLAHYFADKHYHIVIPEKARGQDTKRERSWDVSNLIYELDSLRQKKLVVVGFGEGAYLVPDIAWQNTANQSIAVNAAIYSPLYELEQWAESDTSTPAFNWMLRQKNIVDTTDLRERINSVKNSQYGTPRLSPASNNYWLSYYEKPFMDDLGKMVYPILWINYESHPFISPNSVKLNYILGKTYPVVTHKTLPGTGNIHEKEQMKLLLNEVKDFMNED